MARLIARLPADCIMVKTKTGRAKPMAPLADGQVWRVGDLNLQVGRVGPMLVQYKLAKPDAVRVRSLINGKATIEKYLKKHKAVLLPA